MRIGDLSAARTIILLCCLTFICSSCSPSKDAERKNGVSVPKTSEKASGIDRPASAPDSTTPAATKPERTEKQTTVPEKQVSHRAEPTDTPPAPAVPSSEKKPSPTVEKLTGYMMPAEYVSIPSENQPDAIVAVMLPRDYYDRPQKKYPLVIAFGGAGECAKSPRQGSLAWLHYYKTDEAVKALEKGELEAKDFQGLVSDGQLRKFNHRLKDEPYQGEILVCPSSPLLSPFTRLETPEYEKFIMQDLIPYLARRYRILSEQIGVDGVSMGGSRSMYYGLKYPEVFSSIGSVQGAFGPYMDIYRDLIHKNRDILAQKAIQLVTSNGDVMAPSVERMHKLLESSKIPHKYLVLTGPHDYIFNQGPGALSLLLFHHEAAHESQRSQRR